MMGQANLGNLAEIIHTLLENTSDWQKLGAQVVGGCCRTRPADIADLSEHLT